MNDLRVLIFKIDEEVKEFYMFVSSVNLMFVLEGELYVFGGSDIFINF